MPNIVGEISAQVVLFDIQYELVNYISWLKCKDCITKIIENHQNVFIEHKCGVWYYAAMYYGPQGE